jgi:penicillin amidase
MQAIQGDVANAPSAALAKVMTRVIPQNDMQREAVRYLSRWDGSMDRKSVGASIFVAWSDGLRRRIFADELEGPWNRRGKTRQLESLSGRMQDGELAVLLEDDRLKWCDDVRTPEIETCHQALMLSLETSLKDLKKMHGSDVSEWTWGGVHRTRYAHTPFSQTNLLRPLFQREVANGGSSNSVNVAAASFRGTEGYVQTFGAGFRQIMSMGPRGSRHFYMNSTGQSGNVMSRHYDDMVVPFRDVAYYSLDDQAPAATQPLTLTPR